MSPSVLSRRFTCCPNQSSGIAENSWRNLNISSNKLASESDIKKIQEEVKVLVDESIAFAEESPELEAHELYEDVYMQKDYPFIKD